MRIQPSRARKPSRAAWLALLGLPAVLVTLHTLYWQWTCRRLDDGWQAWTARWSAAGWRIEAGPAVTGGWPLAAQLTVPDPAATAPDGSHWAGERAVLRVSLLRPDRLLVDVPGAQTLSFGNGDRIGFTADREHLDLPLGGADAPGEFTLAASRISLPPSWRSPFGPSVASASAAGRISHVGALPDAGIATLARQWRDRGGSLDLHEFALRWGRLDVSGRATLALDDRLQPAGDGTAVVPGFAEAIAQLADAGSMPRQMAMLATGALSLLSGGTGTAEVPLQLHAGRLSVGQIPLLRLPELAWPDR